MFQGDVSPLYYAEAAAPSSAPSTCVGPDGTSYQCGMCEQGYYCAGGKSKMDPCQDGTFGPPNPVLQYSTQCQPCTPGYYCKGKALTDVNDSCSAGYYCNGSSQTPTPDGTQGWGGECSPGYFCIAGAEKETPCPAGSFANTSGLASCDECPSGYYCSVGAVYPEECPEGYYCPNGTGEYQDQPCPRGTYNNETKAVSDEYCSLCPGGG